MYVSHNSFYFVPIDLIFFFFFFPIFFFFVTLQQQVYLRDQRKRLCEERIINEEPRRKAILRWAMLLLIACSTALTAVLIDYCVRRFTHWKFHLVTKLIEDEKRTAGTLTGACGLYVAIALAYSAIAGTMAAYIEPTAAGSGISEIKTILNGVRLPRVVNVKTLFSKVCTIGTCDHLSPRLRKMRIFLCKHR